MCVCVGGGLLEIALWLRSFVALPVFPAPTTKWLNAVCTSNYRESDTLFWPPQEIQPYDMQTQRNTNINYMIFFNSSNY